MKSLILVILFLIPTNIFSQNISLNTGTKDYLYIGDESQKALIRCKVTYKTSIKCGETKTVLTFEYGDQARFYGIDKINKKIYWPEGKFIFEADLDGKKKKIHYEHNAIIESLYLEDVENKLYFSSTLENKKGLFSKKTLSDKPELFHKSGLQFSFIPLSFSSNKNGENVKVIWRERESTSTDSPIFIVSKKSSHETQTNPDTLLSRKDFQRLDQLKYLTSNYDDYLFLSFNKFSGFKSRISRFNLADKTLENWIIDDDLINYPQGISIDNRNDKIFWVDTNLKTLNYANSRSKNFSSLEIFNLITFVSAGPLCDTHPTMVQFVSF